MKTYETYESWLKSLSSSNDEDAFFSSSVPSQCLSNDCCLGIDEAGRGPVLGPMVYAAAFTPINQDDALRALGLADSKTLSEETREKLFCNFQEQTEQQPAIGYVIHAISPHTISTSMLAEHKTNLNRLSHNAAIGLVHSALKLIGSHLKEVYVDTVGPPDKYQDKLEKLFPQLHITVSKKADALFPVVSAASIVAKVSRDRMLAAWQWREHLDCATLKVLGSGYPGDGVTRKFLEASVDHVFGFPQLVRMSWSTAAQIMAKKCMITHWVDDQDVAATCKRKRRAAEEDVPESGNQSLCNFFEAAAAPAANRISCRRARFFRERALKHMHDFP